jgi:tripartite-type tricarboxylate transporter receptor subunit TctC
MAEELGVNIEVRNEPGAGSLLGIREAANSQPDGYTITNFNPPSSTITQLAEGGEAGVDLRDLTYLGQMGSTSYVAFAQPGFEGDDLQSTIDLYNSGDASVLAGQARGGPVELLAELMKTQYDWGWQEYVGYDGGGDVTAAVLRGEVPVGIATDTAVLSNIEAGDLKIVGVIQSTGSPLFPDVQTATEQNFSNLDYVASLTRVVAAPPDLPSEIRQALEQALRSAVTSEASQQWSQETGNPVEWGDAQTAQETTVESFRVEEEVPNLQEIIGGG